MAAVRASAASFVSASPAPSQRARLSRCQVVGSGSPRESNSLRQVELSDATTPRLSSWRHGLRRVPHLLIAAASGDEDSAPESYDPNDIAVSDEAVPDDLLETLAESEAENPAVGVAPIPEFAAVQGSSWNGAADAPADPDVSEELRRDLKLALLDSILGLDRGFRASSEGRAEIAELVAQLEALNPVPAPAEEVQLLGGRWILAYTSFSELLPLLAVGQLPLVTVGDIVQEVDTISATVINSVTLVGPLTSTTFEASASFEIRSPKRLQIKFQEGSISPPKVASSGTGSSQLPSTVNLFGQVVDLAAFSQALQPLQEAATSALGVLSGLPAVKVQLGSSGAQSWLLTTYLDEDLRVSRGDGGGLFVLVREGSPLQF